MDHTPGAMVAVAVVVAMMLPFLVQALLDKVIQAELVKVLPVAEVVAQALLVVQESTPADKVYLEPVPAALVCNG
jgi:hypothetical protein